jgi:LysM repeat protein
MIQRTSMSGQIKTKLLVMFLVLITALLCFPLEISAQSETPYDLVNAVNDLRALHGLEPYQIDPWLMEYAQEHAEYQAKIQMGTHRHSDGTIPQDIGLQENVAGGSAGIVTVAVVVYKIWADWGHRHILIGYSTGDIGAGIALSENGLVYYTVNIRPGEDAVTVTPRPGTLAPFIPLETSTPSKDGAIIHVVGEGETLWSIAQSYGVTVDDIRRLNSMPDDSTYIYVGQKLLIRPAFTVTPILSAETPSAPTQSLSDTAALVTGNAAPTKTVTPSPSSTIKHPTQSYTVMPTTSMPPETALKNARIGPVVVLAVGVIGLLVTVIFAFRKPDVN